MRIVLGGLGDPIPGLALPDPNISSKVPPQSLILEDGVPFEKAYWTGLGYTHYEVWCIGGVGGRGGTVPGAFVGYQSYNTSYGGAGGGGGLHRVGGPLSDLPDSCPVVVGRAGADGRNGNGVFPRRTRVDPATGLAYVPYIWDPNPEYVESLPGEDGGASSFNVTTCQASGGKGGKPTPWVQPVPGDSTDPEADAYGTQTPGGDGGQGGSGGRTLPGGGGDGAWSEYVFRTVPQPPPHPPLIVYEGADRHDAVDGGWDGTIGKGGGGGRGGVYYGQLHLLGSAPTAFSSSLMHAQIDDRPGGAGFFSDDVILATSGSQGSFSYGDTSVFGVRQSRSAVPSGSHGSGKIIIPGCGGGARLNRLSGYGSYAPGFNPNGIVVIRLIKIV